MKCSKNAIDKRREVLLDLIRKTPNISPSDLAEQAGVSAVTIRRDLRYLEEAMLVSTYYGGVIPVTTDSSISNLKITGDLSATEAKRIAIAKFAATLVNDNDIIFINTSSTCLMILRFIRAKNVTVITNNGNAIKEEFGPELSVILSGGELRRPKESLVGDYAIRNLMTVSAKKSFIGCSGLSYANGMTTENANEVALNEIMLQRVTGKAYVIADSSKIGKTSNYITFPADRITHIITDEFAPEAELTEFRKNGADITIVPIHNISHK